MNNKSQMGLTFSLKFALPFSAGEKGTFCLGSKKLNLFMDAKMGINVFGLISQTNLS